MLRGSSRVTPVAEDYPFEEERIFDRPGFPRLHFVERSYSGDHTNWWIPNRACAEAMLRSAGFRILARPEREVYVCACTPLAAPALPALLDGRKEAP
jgi:tRNA (mo5U34)-methyltransferase